jgi:opacity protein-like surface antigen
MTFHVRQAGFLPSRWISASAMSAALLAALLMSLSLSALAQDQTQSQRAIRVARISLIEGEISYQRGNSAGDDKNTDWFDATINTPLDEKDQVYSGRNGRAEIQFSGRTLARIDRDTNLRITQFNTSTTT